MKTTTIEYQHDDVTLRSYLAFDETENGPRPGILVLPEWWGLSDHPKKRAERLAELGYVALAADMYGNGEVTKDRNRAVELVSGVRSNPQLLRDRVVTNFETLKKQAGVDPKKIAAIGFCFGGFAALELARTGADFCGAVSFHGSLETKSPAEKGKIKAKILVLNGADDSHVPAAQITDFEEEMRKAQADWQFVNYGGAEHAFTNPEADKSGVPGLKYNRSVDERSWKAMQVFFEEIFG